MALSLRHSLRRRFGSVLVDNLFRGLARLGELHPRAKLERHRVERLRNIPYRDGDRPEYLLDVYRPNDLAPGEKRPAVLYIHGGGFRILSKDTHWALALSFARRGYVVFNISYRLAPVHPYPAAVEDACLAYEWVVRNAARYGGDIDRLIVAGESAGANLTTVVTMAACFERPETYARRVFATGVVPKAALPACGLYQVSDPGRFARRKPKLPTFLRDRIHEVHDSYLADCGKLSPTELELADPLLVLEGPTRPVRPLPPFFTTCGTADPILDDTRRLEKALQGRSVPVEAHYYPNEVHAFHALLFREASRDHWRKTYAFLDRLGTSATSAK